MKTENLENQIDYFVLDRPKSTVGGDFYLARKTQKSVYFALGDSTGHGISGGFLSVLGIEFLNQAIELYNSPKDILNYLNIKFYDYITKSNNLSGESLCISLISIKNNTILLSGSKHKLWQVDNGGAIIEFKTDPQILGLNRDYNYSEQSIICNNGDTIFLSSDGYPDQFGQNNEGKFKYKRFRDLLKSTHSKDFDIIKEKLSSTLDNWKGKEEQTDDILLIAVKF